MAKINKDDLKIGVTFTRCKECDRVEVVRCKDCEYLMFSDSYGECAKGYMGIVSPYDFCSKGKRKEVANSG